MFKEISEAVLLSENIIVLPHKSADGDCLGSAFALKLILEKLGKNAVVMLEEPSPKTCGILYGVEEEKQIAPDLVIAVDCGDLGRLGNREGIFKSCSVTINIDHHPTNTKFALYNYVDPDAGATGQIIYELLEYMNIPLTKEIANNLYVAISSDTGRFSYSNTTSKTHTIAAKLHKMEIDHVGINEFLFEKNSKTKIMLMRDALNSFETFSDEKIAVVSITKEQIADAGATEEDAGGLIILPRSLETAKVAICFRESTDDETVKVSFRSNVIDVSSIAQKFGGGGHVRASGCTIDGDISAVKSTVLQEIYKVME